MRTKALKKAKNVAKATGYFRLPNKGKKKCLCVVGVLLDTLGYKLKVKDNMVLNFKEKIEEVFGLDTTELVHQNDNTLKSPYTILKEAFDKKIFHDEIEGEICEEVRTLFKREFPTGIPVTQEVAKKLANLRHSNGHVIDLAFFLDRDYISRYDKDVDKFNDLWYNNEQAPDDLVYRILVKTKNLLKKGA